MAKAKDRGELCAFVNGRWTDEGLHVELLANAEADRRISGLAIERAVADGMDREVAENLYGIGGEGV